MNGRFLVADFSVPDDVFAVGAAVNAWDPRLDVYVPPPDARLFDPDGTLYLISLAAHHTVSYNHRDHVISMGDMMVVPRGLALDVEPEVRMLAIRYDGPPPDHFRERFIQVWGFQHIAASVPAHRGAPDENLVEIIPSTDARYRLSYATGELTTARSSARETGLAITLLLVLEGKAVMTLPREGVGLELPRSTLAALGPGLAYQMEGTGRLGRLIVLAELAHLARDFER